MSGLSGNLLFLMQRLDWYSLIDIGLVTLLFFAILSQFRGTQAAVVLRGIAILIVIVAVLSGMTRLPAFSWLLRTALPALLIALPVVLPPSVRHDGKIYRWAKSPDETEMAAAPPQLIDAALKRGAFEKAAKAKKEA